LQPIFSDAPAIETQKSDSRQTSPQKSIPIRKTVRKRSSEVKGPSIKDALAGKFTEEKLSAKEQHEIYTRAGEVKDFTPEALKIKWDEFVVKLNDRPNLQSTLSRIPQMEQEYQLVLDIDNSVQDDLINTIKPELVSWLRKELKNSKIQLRTRISETEREKVIYTDSEKYMEMLKKNPKLELLKQRFKLDFE